jgi:hypothetical protein
LIILEHASYDFQNMRQLLDKSNILPVYMHICTARPPLWSNGTFYPHKLAITSPTSGGRSVGIVRSRTQTMEFYICIYVLPVYSAMLSQRHTLGIQHKVEGGWDVSTNWKLSERITVPFIPVDYFEAHTVRRTDRMTSDALMAITFYSTQKRKI